MLMLAGLFLPLYLNGQMALLEKEAAPHTERQKADTAKEKQEEKDDIADVSPEEIISKLDSDAQKTKSWFSRERDNLLNFLRRLDSGGSVPDMALPPPDSESNRQAEKPLAVGDPQRADHTGDSAGCSHVLLPVFLSGSEKPAAESA